MKKIIRLILILILGGSGYFAMRHFRKTDKFLYAGTLEYTKIDLSARLSSNIESIPAQEGDQVKKDDPLVTLSCEDVKIVRDLAHRNFKRYSNLAKSGSATPETLDLMRSHKDEADLKLNWCTIPAPISGKILSRYHEPGEWVSPGTKILSLANTQDLWAYIYVPQTLIAKLSLGMKVKALLPELAQEFEAHIIKINEEAEFTPKNVQTREERSRLVFGVKLSFKNASSDVLKPGMTVEVDLVD